MTKLLTIDEAAAMLRKSPDQLRWMRFKKSGPVSAVIGGRILYRLEDVEAFIEDAFAKEVS